MLDDDGNQLSLTFDEMIKMGTSHKMTNEIVLNEFVRNPNSLVEVHRNGSSSTDMGSILGESLAYVIIPKAVIPVAITGAGSAPSTLPFSIAVSLASNWIVWPKRTPASMGLTSDSVKNNGKHEGQHSMQMSNRLHSIANKNLCKQNLHGVM